jgi:hypothetical protein
VIPAGSADLLPALPAGTRPHPDTPGGDLMLLVKEQGGTTIAGYCWENDGDAVDVPQHLAAELLAIQGGDFSVPDDEDDPRPDPPKGRGRRAKPVTEPAPAPAAEVTEPAPAAGAVAEGGEPAE